MRAVIQTCTDKQDVRHMTDAELSRLGVRLLNRDEIILQCKRCRETWSPQLDSNGKLPFNYWLCPAACNR